MNALIGIASDHKRHLRKFEIPEAGEIPNEGGRRVPCDHNPPEAQRQKSASEGGEQGKTFGNGWLDRHVGEVSTRGEYSEGEDS